MSNLPSIAVPITRRSMTKKARAAAAPVVPSAKIPAPQDPQNPELVHRYHIGQRLKLVTGGAQLGRAGGTCHVISLMPPEKGAFSYRVRNEIESFERVVAESDLAEPESQLP